MGTWIKTNGETIEVHPKNGTDYSLKELQGFVGGFIEFVYLADDEIMVANEEGLLNNLPLNAEATAIAQEVIVGDVLICKTGEVK